MIRIQKKKHSTFSKKGQAILKRYLKKIIKFGGAAAGEVEPGQMFNPDDLEGNIGCLDFVRRIFLLFMGLI